jgi:membrane dipeptidase
MTQPAARRSAPLARLAAAIALCGALPLAAQAAQCPLSEISEADAWALHSRVLSIDTHIDINPHYATAQHDPGGFTRSQNDLPKMRAGGLDAAFLILYTGQGALDESGYRGARESAEALYQGIRRMVRAYPEQVGLATHADEVLALHAQGKRAVLIGMENAYPLGASVADVPLWAARGVRYVGLTHMGNNQFGGSSNPNPELGDAETDPGLSPLGHQLVAALNDAGIMIDISHVGPRTMLEATRLSRAPVIASHSGAMGAHRNLRNLEDAQLDAIRASGGEAQMVAFRDYVSELDPAIKEGQQGLRQKHFPDGWAKATPEAVAAYQAGMAELRQAHRDVTLVDFVNHIDYAVRRIGIAHVGIASDFDGGGGVAGWSDASETANVTRELMRRCYSESQIRALWGGNLLRVMREVQARSRP